MTAYEWIKNRTVEVLPTVLNIEEAQMLARAKYPIYTNMKPDPATGKKDCDLTKEWKKRAQAAYIIKLLNNARTEK